MHTVEGVCVGGWGAGRVASVMRSLNREAAKRIQAQAWIINFEFIGVARL